MGSGISEGAEWKAKYRKLAAALSYEKEGRTISPADELSRLSAENERLENRLNLAFEMLNDHGVDNAAIMKHIKSLMERVSTEQTRTQNGNKDTRQYASKSEEFRIQHQCRHLGDTRTEGGMTFCDKCGVELL